MGIGIVGYTRKKYLDSYSVLKKSVSRITLRTLLT